MTTEEKKKIVCPKCQNRMVKQPDLAVLAKFERDPIGAVTFSISDDILADVFVCPSCHYIELYYKRA